MILRPDQLKLMALGMPATPCNFGGTSDSQASTSTTNADQRNNVGSGVGATASSGGTVTLNVQQLDGGAIAAAFGLGENALAGLDQIGTASMSNSAATAQAAINGVLTSAQGAQKAYADATAQAIAAVTGAYQSAGQAVTSQANTTASDVAAAYQDAKTGNQRTLMIGALIVAGLVAAGPLLKKAA